MLQSSLKAESVLVHPAAQIHPTAIIENGAVVEEGVIIGPYCCVGPKSVIKAKVRLISHVSISGDITIGERTKIYPFASLGHPPQDLKYKGEPSKTIIGQDTTIREYVTVQPGTAGDKMLTKVGDRCLLMVSTHVAHDCTVGNNVIMANNATLAGHVEIGDFAIIGGLSAIQQFVRIGAHAIIGGMSGVEKDVIPYAMVKGDRAYLNGLNLVGLKRRGFSAGTIHELMDIYQKLFENNDKTPLSERLESLQNLCSEDLAVKEMLDFILKDSKKSLCMPK
jgi:UDP-N-acetylglucosamine acyltransferase